MEAAFQTVLKKKEFHITMFTDNGGLWRGKVNLIPVYNNGGKELLTNNFTSIVCKSMCKEESRSNA